MSNKPALAATEAAIAQLYGESLEIEPCPFQTLGKSQANGLTLWFTFRKRGEDQSRELTLLFDQTKEVQFLGPDYLRECQRRIVEEIRSFWDGVNSAPKREASIP